MLNSVFLFLNLGGGEIFIVILMIVMFFGSDKLPGIAKGLGKGLAALMGEAKLHYSNASPREEESEFEEARVEGCSSSPSWLLLLL